jgi:multiple sugar transport system permease protein
MYCGRSALCWGQVLQHGEHGKRTLFVLPAALFVISLTVFPLLFGLIIAFSDWNLSSPTGRQFNGTGQCVADVGRSVLLERHAEHGLVCAGDPCEYAIAFGLALLLNAEIRARKFFRVAFLLPLMLSPVAVSWMIGKSMLEPRFGPSRPIARRFWAGTTRRSSKRPGSPSHHHGDGCLDLHPLHDDHDPGRACRPSRKS